MRKAITWSACAAAAVVMALLVFAQADSAADGREDGWNKALTQSDMNKAAAAEFQKKDAELRKVVAQLRERSDQVHRQKLDEAQLQWDRFRKAEAEFRADRHRGGTVSPMIYHLSLTRTTELRLRQLKSLLSNTTVRL